MEVGEKDVKVNERERKMGGIRVSAPGRVCLFGEHQDYLNLPVITAAINLRIRISGKQNGERHFHIALPDINSEEMFDLPPKNKDVPYQKERDYFRSVFNVVRRHGVKIGEGWDCEVHGNIPINSGTSSSSALCVAWARFLTEISSVQKPEFVNPYFIAKLAHLAEVVEFNEPGGMMDHYASAMGGLLYQEFGETVKLQPFTVKLGTFVLGDSLQPKDTKGILARVKFGVLDALKIIKKENPQFDLKTVPYEQVNQYRSILTPAQMEVLQGAVLNRDLTQQAKTLMNRDTLDERQFGELLNEHQKVLAGLLKISTPKIDRMLQAALDAGALGGKINGSGGGGCMFVYAPENAQKIARSIEMEGGKAYIVSVDDGVRVEE